MERTVITVKEGTELTYQLKKVELTRDCTAVCLPYPLHPDASSNVDLVLSPDMKTIRTYLGIDKPFTYIDSKLDVPMITLPTGTLVYYQTMESIPFSTPRPYDVYVDYGDGSEMPGDWIFVSEDSNIEINPINEDSQIHKDYFANKAMNELFTKLSF